MLTKAPPRRSRARGHGRIPLGGIDVSERTCSINGCTERATRRGWCGRHYIQWYRHGDPLSLASPASVEDRFWAKVDKTGSDGCWLWTASLNTSGYGQFSPGEGVSGRAHRFAYEVLVGPIPSDRQLDHLCRVRHCVNPAHLEVVTNKENTLRGIGVTARNAAKTHCVNGHPFDDTNTYVPPTGGRLCRICRVAADLRFKQRRRERAVQ